jgi:hypothetical protein
MKIKHNKKRNTALVYESLIREATVASLKNDQQKKEKVIQIIKEFFSKTSVLKKDLECYYSLQPKQNLKKEISEKILNETKAYKKLIDPSELFEKQTELIKTINKELSPSVFNNFVPSYKSLATISQMFSNNITPKNKIILENKIITDMSQPTDVKGSSSKMNKSVYRIFANKFNEKYDNTLLPEQKELLNHYVSSFSDNALSLKVFLNEEIARLKKELENAKLTEEVKADQAMLQKTDMILESLNAFYKQPIEDKMLLKIMRTQALVREVNDDGN